MTPILLTALCLIPIGLLLAVGLCRAAAEAIVAKNRDGATGSVGLYWNAELSMFGNTAQVNL